MEDLKTRVANALDRGDLTGDITTIYAELEDRLREIIESVKSESETTLETACSDLDILNRHVGEVIGAVQTWKPKVDSDPNVIKVVREAMYDYLRFLVKLSETVDATKRSFLKGRVTILKEGLLRSLD